MSFRMKDSNRWFIDINTPKARILTDFDETPHSKFLAFKFDGYYLKI